MQWGCSGFVVDLQCVAVCCSVLQCVAVCYSDVILIASQILLQATERERERKRTREREGEREREGKKERERERERERLTGDVWEDSRAGVSKEW